MGLTELDPNKCVAILQFKSQISNRLISDTQDTQSDRVVNKYGETEVKRIAQHQKQSFSQEEVGTILSEYQSGKTTIELAKQFGCHRTTISGILKRNGVRVDNSKAIKKLDAERVISLYAEMHTAAEIAKMLNSYPQVIIRCLKDNGIKLRKRWDYSTGN